MKKIIIALMMAAAITGCTRIGTGEAGIRVDINNTTLTQELPTGSWNQTLVGKVIKVPVKEISADVTDLTPMASDNSTMKDFDATVLYSLNPTSVAELYSQRAQTSHAVREDGETLLMYHYMQRVTKNAIFKVARDYSALTMNDSRAEIENKILAQIQATLEKEHLTESITVSQVLVRGIVPSDAVKQSADELVRAQNEAKQKAVEVGTAKLEAERIAALNANAGATSYMDSMANMKIAEAVAAGKVNTIIIPRDFKGMVNVK
jgi:regulator of protease activity HflC (stomatin/prohibitin superfamily)